MKYELQHDHNTDTFFLDFYIPKSLWEQYPYKVTAFSRGLLDFKNTTKGPLWSDYTIELLCAVSKLVNDTPSGIKSAYLACVPSSDPDGRTTMINSIKMITDLYVDGTAAAFTDCKKPLIDASGLFIRTKQIRSSHMCAVRGEPRPTIAEHLDTLSIRPGYYPQDALFIIMDDIVTRGNSLWACRKLLLDAGIYKSSIRLLAFGKTI